MFKKTMVYARQKGFITNGTRCINNFQIKIQKSVKSEQSVFKGINE